MNQENANLSCEDPKAKLEREANNLYTKSKALVTESENKKPILKSEEDRTIASIYLKEAAAFKKKINESYKKIYDKQKAAVKALKEEWNSQLEIPAKAYDLLSQAIGEFDAQKEREAAEKARLEQERIEKERLAKAEEMEEKADELREAGREEEAQMIQEESESLLDMPEPIVILQKQEKIAGTRKTKYIKCELVDEKKCVQFILDKIRNGDTEFIRFLSVNMKDVRAFIKYHDGKFVFDGVKIWEEWKTSITG